MILGLLICAAAFTVLALGAWVADRPPPPTRPDQRIPAEEQRLLGDSLCDHVGPYFERRWESAVRTRAVVDATCEVTYDWQEQ